jgi:hypothetical protein
VVAGQTWNLQLRDLRNGTSLATNGFVTVARYTTVFGDTLSTVASRLGTILSTLVDGTGKVLFDATVNGRVITIANATADQAQDIEANLTVGLTKTTQLSVWRHRGRSADGWPLVGGGPAAVHAGQLERAERRP